MPATPSIRNEILLNSAIVVMIPHMLILGVTVFQSNRMVNVAENECRTLALNEQGHCGHLHLLY